MVNLDKRQYQDDAVQAICQSDARRMLMVMPTGAGKTITFGRTIGELQSERTLVIAHRKEIIEQTAKTLSAMYPDKSVGLVMGAREKELDADIMVGTWQTIARRSMLELMPRDVDLVVIDEAHHAPAPSYRRILYAYNLLDYKHTGAKNADGVVQDTSKDRRLLGVTATADRTDRKSVDVLFDKRVVDISIIELIPDYLADFKISTVQSRVDLSDVSSRGRHGDLREEEVAEEMRAAGFIAELPSIIREHAPDRKHIMLFCPDVSTTEEACDVLNGAGISAVAVLGKTDIKAREADLNAFKAGDVRVMCNCMVYTEGVDIPHIDCVLIARPTRSAPLLVQMVGRGLRARDGKADCLIVDIAYKRKQGDLETAVKCLLGDMSDLHAPDKSYLEIDSENNMRLVRKAKELREKDEAEQQERNETAMPAGLEEVVSPALQLVIDSAVLRGIGGKKSPADVWRQLARWRPVGKPNTLDANDVQKELLVKHGISEEAADALNKTDAGTLIHVIKDNALISEKQRVILRGLDINDEDMPAEMKLATRMITRLLEIEELDSPRPGVLRPERIYFPPDSGLHQLRTNELADALDKERIDALVAQVESDGNLGLPWMRVHGPRGSDRYYVRHEFYRLAAAQIVGLEWVQVDIVGI